MAQRETLLAAESSRAAEFEVRPLALKLFEMEAALARVIRGKPEALRLALVAVLSRGHLLIEDVPGVGKTTLALSLARAVDGRFLRLQFTSDMLPSDILGVTIFNAQTQEFEFKPGPIFTNFLLADEINRATPKTQGALLEAMNEGQVTVEGRSYPLEQPFLVIATQNPVEHHGAYPLPESQLDRFLMRIRIGYPGRESERQIVRQSPAEDAPILTPVISSHEVMELQKMVSQVRVDNDLVDYMLAIVDSTRNHGALSLGVSPRGAQALFRAAQAMAAIEGRDYVIPDDIKHLAVPVFAHRLMLNSRFGGPGRSITDSSEKLIEEILTTIPVPI